MQMFVAGQWQGRSESIKVVNPFNGEVIDTVPRGAASDVDQALTVLVEGAKLMRAMPSAQRCQLR